MDLKETSDNLETHFEESLSINGNIEIPDNFLELIDNFNADTDDDFEWFN
jgi:hypothetical protein